MNTLQAVLLPVLLLVPMTVLSLKPAAPLAQGGGHEPVPELLECGGEHYSGTLSGTASGAGDTCSAAIESAIAAEALSQFDCQFCDLTNWCSKNYDVTLGGGNTACWDCVGPGLPRKCATVTFTAPPTTIDAWCDSCP